MVSVANCISDLPAIPLIILSPNIDMKLPKIFLLSTLLTLSLPAAGQTEQDNTLRAIQVHDNQTGEDEVLELPEGMTRNPDSLLREWNARQYLFADTTQRFTDLTSSLTPEDYAARLQRLPAVMELPYNSVVRSFIDQYTGRLRNSVAYMLGAGNLYIPIFEEALDYYGLPLELKYLPVIESGLDPTAVSRVGAVGLWQFMLKTGKRYGLEVNSLVDERRDPIKATWAAARYLKDLYDIFADWNLVIAAYNCGPTNISKAIHRAGGAKDYWTIYPYLPKETRGYVPAFIAANYIMNYYCDHGITPLKTRHPIATDTLVVDHNVHFDQIAAVCQVDIEALESLNPQYRKSIVPGATKPSTLRLPETHLLKYIDLQDSIRAYRSDELLARRATVIPAEAEPAVKPQGSSRQSKSKARQSRNARTRNRTVTIRQGDTLEAIAKRNGTTVAKLRRLNGIKGSNIRAGKKIKIQ